MPPRKSTRAAKGKAAAVEAPAEAAPSTTTLPALEEVESSTTIQHAEPHSAPTTSTAETVDEEVEGEEEKLEGAGESAGGGSGENTLQDRMAKMKQLRQRMVRTPFLPDCSRKH